MSLADEIGSRRCDLLFAAPGQPLAVIEIDGSQHRVGARNMVVPADQA